MAGQLRRLLVLRIAIVFSVVVFLSVVTAVVVVVFGRCKPLNGLVGFVGGSEARGSRKKKKGDESW